MDGSGEVVVEVKRAFISAGCNRIVNNVSWGASDLVSFGTHNAVAIFSPKSAQILTTLPAHKAAVNCTHWLPSNKFTFRAKGFESHYLLSGDADGVIVFWELSLAYNKWRHVLQLPQLHKKGITCIAGYLFSRHYAAVASSSSDGVVCIWDVLFPSSPGGDCTLSCRETISVGSRPMVAISLGELPGKSGHLVLAMGGLDNKVNLYCAEEKGRFVRACELKGHTDWVRSLDLSLPICSEDGTDCTLLVSSSQDRGIRIWKIKLRGSLAEKQDAQSKDQISLASYIEGPVFVAGTLSYQISLESLLIGHEDWVYSVQWQPPMGIEHHDAFHQPQSILSASMDKTMMIWQPERKTGIWMNVVTVGELNHCALGFYGCHWSPDGCAILAHGYGGSFHLWKNIGLSTDNWQPQKVPSGHFAPVSDITWAKSGEYLLSVSHDQTTRVFAPWNNHISHFGSWHEIARPQVHGHDINCVTIIQAKGNHRFVSGAEEKVARVFEAPLSFLKTLQHTTSQLYSLAEDIQMDVQVLGANMSALGLSQKPIYVNAFQESPERTGNDGFDTLESVPDAVPVELTEPPIEDQLSWHTLWPESHKLYGHGNELFSLCCDHEGKLVASSCKAQSAAVAEIWLWQVGSWKAVGRLQSHTLTVTQMEFSHEDNFLLSVSRDRHFSIFSINRTATGEVSYKLVVRKEAHKRIIWACSWSPFCNEFATGSRDKAVKIWAIQQGRVEQLLALPQFSSSVTALSWAGLSHQEKNYSVLAVGMESGLIELWSLSRKRAEVADRTWPVMKASVLVRLDPYLCHASPVNRVVWRNCENGEKCGNVQLASCGADSCVRVFDVILD